VKLSKPLELQRGGALSDVTVKYATFGKPDLPTVLLCPSMSNTCFPVDIEEAQQKGWWNGVVGTGDNFGIDLDKYHVIVVSPLGSPHGSLCPLSPSGVDDAVWGPRFPSITPADMADLNGALVQDLGVQQLHAVIGGSMGGMQSMQFAIRFSHMVDRCAAIASTGWTSPATVALRAVQRKAIRMDPAFKEGLYDSQKENWPLDGMALARRFGTICYRSRSEFDARFSWTAPEQETDKFEVESYLDHQAFKFEGVYDPNCYLLLSEAMDRMNLGYGYDSLQQALARFGNGKQVMLLPYNTDVLMPPSESQKLAKVWKQAGASSYCEVLQSTFGHDAFLVQAEASRGLNSRLSAFLSEGVDGAQRVYEQTVRDLDGGL